MYEGFPLLQPGQTYVGSTDTMAPKFLGAERTDIDYNWASTGAVKAIRSYRQVTRRLVKNDSGIAILPKYAVVLDETGTLIKGYGRIGTNAGVTDRIFLVDEFIPTAGVANGNYCFIVVEGPATGITSKIAADENSIALGARLIAATAAASTHSTTAGRLGAGVGATSVLALEVLGSLGRALTAKTTANTDADILVQVSRVN